MPLRDSYEVYIEVDGIRLLEYDIAFDAKASPPTVSCWIPSQSGKTFTIKCTNLQLPRHVTQYFFDIDGVRVDNRINRADHGPFAHMRATSELDNINAPGGRRLLTFADLELTDDDEALSRQPNASLGEIAVQVRRIIVNDRYQRPHPVPGVALFTGKVHERSKKAGVHSVGLGPVSTAQEPWAIKYTGIDPPLLAFMFRYRPLALLQAQGIAPPPTPVPSPTPSPAPRLPSPDVEIKNEGGVGDADKDEEIRRLRAEIASLKKRKRDAEPTVKSEPVTQRPRTSGGSNEVIDLTSD